MYGLKLFRLPKSSQKSKYSCGMDICSRIHKVDPDIQIVKKAENGQELDNRQTILEIKGRARSILKGERVALNLLGRMCGIATITRTYVRDGDQNTTFDTRKRHLVLDSRKIRDIGRWCSESSNGLCDGVIVKENHIRAGGIEAAVSSLMDSLPPTIKIEVETTNLDEVTEALEAGADIIMLDNES